MSNTETPRIMQRVYRLIAEGHPTGDLVPCPTCQHGVYINPDISADALEVEEYAEMGISPPSLSRTKRHIWSGPPSSEPDREWTCSDCGSRHAAEDYAAETSGVAA